MSSMENWRQQYFPCICIKSRSLFIQNPIPTLPTISTFKLSNISIKSNNSLSTFNMEEISEIITIVQIFFELNLSLL